MSIPDTKVLPAAEVPGSTAAAPEPPVLACRNLRVWYGSALALNDISIEIPRNQITALIGPSGVRQEHALAAPTSIG